MPPGNIIRMMARRNQKAGMPKNSPKPPHTPAMMPFWRRNSFLSFVMILSPAPICHQWLSVQFSPSTEEHFCFCTALGHTLTFYQSLEASTWCRAEYNWILSNPIYTFTDFSLRSCISVWLAGSRLILASRSKHRLLDPKDAMYDLHTSFKPFPSDWPIV